MHNSSIEQDVFFQFENGVLPLSLRFDFDGRCISYGSLFKKLTPNLRHGSKIHANFNLVTPESLEDVTPGGKHRFVLKIKENSLILKGECQVLEDHSIFAIVSPEIQSISDLMNLGINIGDFPNYLPIQQLAFMRETMEMGRNESFLLIEQLEKEKRKLSFQKRQLDLALVTADVAVFELDPESQIVTIYSPGNLLKKYGMFNDRKMPLTDFMKIVDSDFQKQFLNYLNNSENKMFLNKSLEVQLVAEGSGTEWWQVDVMSSIKDPIVHGVLTNIKTRKEKEDAMIKAEESNRRRFSLQVHDLLCQKLVAVRMIMDIPAIDESKKLLDELIYDSRAIINTMDISFLEEANAEQAFKKYIDNTSRMYKGKITFSWVGELDISPPSLAFNIFRLFQEIMFYALVESDKNVSIKIENKNIFCIFISGIALEEEELAKLEAIELELRLPERKSELKVYTHSTNQIAVEFCVDL
ncbi:MAG: signal transduction histidine kinase [Cyclobacteriaceae bacterium]|jgi:signal transduction histidine kinase